MENLLLGIPETWNELPIKLSRITTSEDNKYLMNDDIAMVVEFDPNDAGKYIKNGDIVTIETENEKFDYHAFLYQKIKGKHHFIPISNFENKTEFAVTNLNEIKILAKILGSFREISEKTSFIRIEI